VYQTKVKIDDEQMAAIALDRQDFYGEWNYTLRPQTTPRRHMTHVISV